MYEEELYAGFESGRQFADAFAGLKAEPESIKETQAQFQALVDMWPLPLSGPFVTLVSGAIGAAAAARLANDYPALTQDQLAAYLAHSADILDSLKHV